MIKRLVVPVEAKPGKAAQNRIDRFLRGAFAIRIFDPQEELAARVPRVKPVEQGRARAPDVQIAGGRGRKTQDGLRIFWHDRFWSGADCYFGVAVASSKPVPAGVGPSPVFGAFENMAQTSQWRGIFAHPLSWLRDSARAERERWALWLPVGLGAGIGIYFALPFEPPLWGAFALAGIGAVVCAIAVARSFAVPFLVGLLAATCFGFSIAKFRTEEVAAPVLTHKMGPVKISGCVESVRAKNDGMQTVLYDLTIQRLNPPPQKIRMSFRNDDPALQPGTCIQFKGVLMPPPGPAEPGGYDFGRSAFFERIGAVGYAYGHPHAVANFGEPTFREKISIAIEHLRFAMTQRIHAALPGSTGGIAAALITGDRGAISEDDESALRDAGLAHVLAIAGLHMALVGLGLFWAVRAILALFPTLALTQPIKKWAALAALGSASFYLIISGAATPATRAFVMLAMMMLSVLADRPTLSMRSLALAAAIILLFTPESLIEPGFQMSFAAVASLIAIVEWEQARAQPHTFERPRFATLRRYLGGIAITSFVGSLATAPYAIYHFDRAAHYAVLGNLLAMPVMGFIVMPMAAIAVILMPFGLEAIPLQLMGWGIEIMLSVGKWVSHLPGAVSTVAAMPMSALIMLSLGGLWILLWRSAWRWLGLLPMAISVVLIFSAKLPDLLVSRDGLTVAIRQSIRSSPRIFAQGERRIFRERMAETRWRFANAG